MSFGNGYNGGRTRMKTKMFLNIYDLSPANDVLYHAGLGFHHSGVEIMGTEYSFASGGGVFESQPKQVPNAKFREQLELGSFDGGMQELNRALDELRSEFRSDSYNLIKRNCNHFANALSWKLLRRRIPSHVNRWADLANCCPCLIPKKLLEEAPVGHQGASSSRSFAVPTNASMQRAAASSAAPKKKQAMSFSGAGHTLGSNGAAAGGTSNSGTSNGFFSTLSSIGATSLGAATAGATSRSSSPADDLTDRREKARKAALARLERNAGGKQSQD